MEDKVIYIHYGDNEFRQPNPIRNRWYFTKPYGGLWASRKGGKCTWKEWCEQEEFRLEQFGSNFMFTIREDANVLELCDCDQLNSLPKLHPYCQGKQYDECCLDFEKLAEKYDAIEVMDINQLYFALYGWDCNSILIMNPEIVEIIKED